MIFNEQLHHQVHTTSIRSWWLRKNRMNKQRGTQKSRWGVHLYSKLIYFYTKKNPFQYQNCQQGYPLPLLYHLKQRYPFLDKNNYSNNIWTPIPNYKKKQCLYQKCWKRHPLIYIKMLKKDTHLGLASYHNTMLYVSVPPMNLILYI